MIDWLFMTVYDKGEVTKGNLVEEKGRYERYCENLKIAQIQNILAFQI